MLTRDKKKIERILQKREKGGCDEYLVKWKGLPESSSTWVKFYQILDQLNECERLEELLDKKLERKASDAYSGPEQCLEDSWEKDSTPSKCFNRGSDTAGSNKINDLNCPYSQDKNYTSELSDRKTELRKTESQLIALKEELLKASSDNLSEQERLTEERTKLSQEKAAFQSKAKHSETLPPTIEDSLTVSSLAPRPLQILGVKSSQSEFESCDPLPLIQEFSSNDVRAQYPHLLADFLEQYIKLS